MNQISKDRAEYQVIFKNKEIKRILLTGERASNIMRDMNKSSFLAIQDIDGSVHGVNTREIERIVPIGYEEKKSAKGEYTIYLKDTVVGKGKLHDGTEVFVMLFERRYINGDGVVSSWHSYFLNGSENKISVSEAQEILSRK